MGSLDSSPRHQAQSALTGEIGSLNESRPVGNAFVGHKAWADGPPDVMTCNLCSTSQRRTKAHFLHWTIAKGLMLSTPYQPPQRTSLERHRDGRRIFFEEQDGSTFTRANCVRPLDDSHQRYYWLSAVCYVSLGGMFCMGAVRANEPVERYGHAIIGAGFLAIAFGSLLILALDGFSRWMLSGMTRRQMRARLRRAERSHRYVVKRRHIRGVTIGAIFFGTLAIYSLCLEILTLAGIIEGGPG